MDLVRLYLTMVLPAPFGCNLKCPFCAIAHRKEAQTIKLLDESYCLFLLEVSAKFVVSRFAIQGYEPLLPQSWPLTKRLLTLADHSDLGTALVTNGIQLRAKSKELSGLVDVLTVSLDSFRPERHDELRGVKGAWKKTTDGIKEAAQYFNKDLQVASVLFPGGATDLVEMPALLRKLGVSEWVVAPVLNFSNGVQLVCREEVHDSLILLDESASKEGVHLYLSDELRHVTSNELFNTMNVKSLEDTDYIVRLSPDGTCSRGTEALHEAIHAPVWDQCEDPVRFLERILAETGKEIQKK